MNQVRDAKMESSSGPTYKSLHFFCDFDGTIAVQDMIGRIAKEFLPDVAADIIGAVNQRKLTVKAGIEVMFEQIESRRYDEVCHFAVGQTVIRPGFAQFVEVCVKRGWKLTVISGGFDFFVQPALVEFRDQLEIYCNAVDTTTEHLQVIWNTPCDTLCDSGGCGLCKPSVMRQLTAPNECAIVIGDGVTDVFAAQHAKFAYARDVLLRMCQEFQLPHRAFNDFYDIISDVENPQSEVHKNV